MTYLELINYLKSLGAEHRSIEFTAFGDFEEILGAERNRICYPCLWIESPSGKIVGDLDIRQISWQVSFAVLINAKPDDIERQINNLDRALSITLQIIARIRKDIIENTLFDADITNTEVNPIWSAANDNDQGFHVSFQITAKNADLCYKSEEWD